MLDPAASEAVVLTYASQYAGCASRCFSEDPTLRGGRGQGVADVWLRSRVASIPQIPPPVHSDGDVRDYFERVVLAEQEVWVAEADGVVVALLTLNGDWIEQKYVDPDYWGRRH